MGPRSGHACMGLFLPAPARTQRRVPPPVDLRTRRNGSSGSPTGRRNGTLGKAPETCSGRTATTLARPSGDGIQRFGHRHRGVEVGRDGESPSGDGPDRPDEAPAGTGPPQVAPEPTGTGGNRRWHRDRGAGSTGPLHRRRAERGTVDQGPAGDRWSSWVRERRSTDHPSPDQGATLRGGAPGPDRPTGRSGRWTWDDGAAPRS